MTATASDRRPAAPQTHLAGELDGAVQHVLGLLRDRGLDVVFVGQFTDGHRHFRVVEAARHGLAAAHAAGQLPADVQGMPLSTPIVLRNGRVYGMLCCFTPGTDTAIAERDMRTLRYSARLAARLLDNQQVLRDLEREALMDIDPFTRKAVAAVSAVRPSRPARSP